MQRMRMIQLFPVVTNPMFHQGASMTQYYCIHWSYIQGMRILSQLNEWQFEISIEFLEFMTQANQRLSSW